MSKKLNTENVVLFSLVFLIPLAIIVLLLSTDTEQNNSTNIADDINATETGMQSLTIIHVERTDDNKIKVFDASKSVVLTDTANLSDEILLMLKPGDTIEYLPGPNDDPVLVRNGILTDWSEKESE